MSVTYTITPVHPEAHLFEVVLQLDNPDVNGQEFELPNWIPGSYMIRDFAKNIVDMNASSQGKAVAIEKLTKSSWRLPPKLGELTLTYRVYAWDLSVRTAHLDNTHGFFNNTSVCLSVKGYENDALTVHMQAPPSAAFKHWRLATTLPVVNVDANGFGEYRAADYDELIDHPVEMGTFETVTFEACGVTHDVVLTGTFSCDLERIAKDLKTICEYQIRFFGEPAPVKRYLFMVMVVDAGYGGLEHRASTALLVTRDHLPSPGMTDADDKYIEFLGLCSHEYFHTWNVKRIKPAKFIPFSLQHESYTQLLWFFEGITSYYDDLMLVRAGLIDQKQYLDLVSKNITRIRRGAGRTVQSITDSSFYAWTKFYKQDENAPNAIVSYYGKGALIALCLDYEIRRATKDTRSLDDLMLLLWQQWLDTKSGLSEQEPEQLASQIAGTDLGEFFNTALYSTDDLALDSALEYLGVAVHWRRRRSAMDTGGSEIKKPDEAAEPQPWLGANIRADGGRAKVTHVFSGSAAELAGLAAGDILIAINNLMIDGSNVASVLARYKNEDSLPLHYSRFGVLTQTQLPLMPAPMDTCSLEKLPEHNNNWPFNSDMDMPAV